MRQYETDPTWVVFPPVFRSPTFFGPPWLPATCFWSCWRTCGPEWHVTPVRAPLCLWSPRRWSRTLQNCLWPRMASPCKSPCKPWGTGLFGKTLFVGGLFRDFEVMSWKCVEQNNKLYVYYYYSTMFSGMFGKHIYKYVQHDCFLNVLGFRKSLLIQEGLPIMSYDV